MPNLKILYNRVEKPKSRNQDVPVHPSLYFCLLIESVGLVLNTLNLFKSIHQTNRENGKTNLYTLIVSIYILMSLPLITSTVHLLKSSFKLQKIEEALGQYVLWFTIFMSLRLLLVFWICLTLYLNAEHYLAKLVWQIDPKSDQYGRLLSLLQLYSLINFNQIAICYWLQQWACQLTQQLLDLMPDVKKKKTQALYLHQQPQDNDFDIEKVGLLQNQNRIKAKSRNQGKNIKQFPVIVI